MKTIRLESAISLALCALFVCPVEAQEKKEPDQLPGNIQLVKKEQAIAVGVEQLIKIQDEDGAWPYEGVYRVRRKIPVGYRIGGTAICCEALMYATTADNLSANGAIERGIQLILAELEHPLMKPSQEDRYDVRVWGHIYALDLFCRLKADRNRFPRKMEQIETWIPKLTESLLQEELENGGWNYASRRSHAGFVTSPAVQALLWAQQSGQEVPAEVLERAAKVLFRSRNAESAFVYSGYESDRRPTKLPGSIARSAICETTLSLLGLERQNAIHQSIDAFHEHWDELEKRRKKTGTHKPPYGIAPYYFYYGHRYVAQAIGRLPTEKRAAEFAKLYDVILKTRDPDGTWNDRVFEQSRAYGTAMILLAITAEKVPMPRRNQ